MHCVTYFERGICWQSNVFLNKSDLISFKNKQKSNNSIIQLAVVIVATASWKHPLLIQKKTRPLIKQYSCNTFMVNRFGLYSIVNRERIKMAAIASAAQAQISNAVPNQTTLALILKTGA